MIQLIVDFETAETPTHNRFGLLCSGGTIQINENLLDITCFEFDTAIESSCSHRLKSAPLR